MKIKSLVQKISPRLRKQHCAVASLVIVGGAFLYSLDQGSIRQPVMRKPLPFSHHVHRGITEKIRGPISVVIQAQQNFEMGSPLIYIAKITTEENVSQLQYEWSLSPGLELVRGSLQSTLSQIRPGEVREIEIVVRSLTDENQQLNFVISGKTQEIAYSATAQYNTVDQPAIDEHIGILHEKTKAAMGKKKIRHRE